MEKVTSATVEIARYVTEFDHTQWPFFKSEFPEAVYDEVRKKYLSLNEDFFDNSDLRQLENEILNGEVVHLENICLAPDYYCYYNEKTTEYIAVMIPNSDLSLN
ncbi:hypothetical protein [Enterococcus wangshanyuanii]|uniref:Uncharacterized protein n=1 Tax=Enterococcus wangshanyuanii TaxID=2005703 RepID=A0ABQ1PU06_9ENTE|nr:hypothetical protein [Enterococcus wangshanyuanii]GGD03332.1 hypothetical protein GCM10011573_36000 [Enterococcus wangshanyuanii]